MRGLLQGAMRPSPGASEPMRESSPDPRARPESPTRRRGQPARAKRTEVDPKRMKPQREALANGMLQLLYGPMLDRSSQILKESAEQPQSGVARVLSGLMSAAYTSVEEQGRAVPPAVMFQAGMVGAQAIGEMADGLGVLDQRRDAELIEAGFMEGLARFGEQNADRLTDEERQRYIDLIGTFGAEREKAMAQRAGAGEATRAPVAPDGQSMPAPGPQEVRHA